MRILVNLGQVVKFAFYFHTGKMMMMVLREMSVLTVLTCDFFVFIAIVARREEVDGIGGLYKDIK